VISEFPEAAQNFSGETIDELLKLSEAGIIRVVVPGRQHHIVDLHHPDLTRLRSVESVREPFDDHWYTIQTLRRPPRAWVGGTHISGVSNPHQTARIGIPEECWFVKQGFSPLEVGAWARRNRTRPMPGS